MVVRVKRESAVEAELLVRVKAAGGVCIKTTVIGQRGFFDRLVILPPGRVVFVEVKRPRGGRLSPHQILWLAKAKALDVVACVISDTSDIDRLLANEKGRGE